MKKRSSAQKSLKRSTCPVANCLDILGDKWTLLLVRDLFLGKSTYGEFQDSPEKIPTNLLSERLKRLEGYGIIIKHPYQQKPVRYSYTLTDKGRALKPVLKAVLDWGINYIPGTDTRMLDAYLKKKGRKS